MDIYCGTYQSESCFAGSPAIFVGQPKLPVHVMPVPVPVPVKKTEKRTIFADTFRGGGIQSRIRNVSDSDLRRRHAHTPIRRHAHTSTGVALMSPSCNS
jgi:hypothetical protein